MTKLLRQAAMPLVVSPFSFIVLYLCFFAQPSWCGEPASGIRQRSSSPTINEALVHSAGIRRLSGQYIVIYTDLPAQGEVEQLPDIFDRAVPQWAEYFAVPRHTLEHWKVNGYVIQDKEKFQSAGLIPVDLPPYLHGYQLGREFWINEQPSAYYRRHLLLHEGTHAFMKHFLGSAGPPWFMEGIAEMLGTHGWHGNVLRLGLFPKGREQVPYWGRVKVVREDVRGRRARTLDTVMKQSAKSFLEVESYAWSWAAISFLEKHPRYQTRFRAMLRQVGSPDFTEKMRETFEEDWMQLNEEWQLFVLNLDYGYDIAREAVAYRAGMPLRNDAVSLTITAERGWQSSGVVLESGNKYRVSASGRFQIAKSTQPWWCEPNGITIRYHSQRPLGILLGAIKSDPSSTRVTPLARPMTLGLERMIAPKRSGTLYLRVNDSPAELADNLGTIKITVEHVK